MTQSANRLAPLMSSVRGDWQTPENVLELVRLIGPIGLDPCTAADNPTGARISYTGFGACDDGLTASWGVCDPGELIYCNPPYGRGIGAWIRRCAEAAQIGDEVIALVPARPDTRWFQKYCAPPASDAVCFWKGRLKFKGAEHPAPFPSALVYWGEQSCTFDAVFRDHGVIWT